MSDECRAMFLLMDGTLMRGDDSRKLQLCDLFWYPVRQVRPHQGYALGAVSDQGKTNKVCIACSQCINIADSDCSVEQLKTSI